LTVSGDGNEFDITNGELCYYFWGEYYYYVQSYGFSFDAATDLDQQSYSDTQTWEDYFMESACSSIIQIEALKAEAEAAGFTMPEDYQEEFDSTIDSMADYALQSGFTDSDGNGDVLAYIQDSYGKGATIDSFTQYLYDSYYVTAYSDEIYNGLTFTDEEIEAYYDENSDLFTAYGIEKSDLPDVNVRHILIMPDTDTDDEDEELTEEEQEAQTQAAWDEALAEAQRILDEWSSGDATEESFAELANTYSTDGGSNTTGGLYEDVYPGQMVTNFNDWCFDESRQPGDTGIVESDWGYHIMYFVGFTDEYYWKETAESELRYDSYQDTLDGILDLYTSTVTDQLHIPTPDAVKSIQEQAAASAATEDTTEEETSTAG
jgi:hypothetical protein